MTDDARPSADESPTVLTAPRDQAAPTAPAVVAVVVTHDPGPWFDDVLRSLAEQTYQQLSVLVVDAASGDDPTPRVAAVLPDARVKRLDRAPGYGAAANVVLDLVEGAAFYLLLHDDVALDREAVRYLVEEAFRTNGGVLGPKLLDWHDPRRIRSVGGSVDKTAAPAPFAEPGELDQEQHDAVRDVFYLAGGATLVRADLFATIGGFDPGITYHGDDVDLCWRAHLAGARVVIVPAATARHLEALGVRRPDDDRRRLQQRHRVRALLSNYGPVHLVRVASQAMVMSALEAIFAVVSGRFGHAADVAGAWSWNLRHGGAVLRRRRRNARIRTVKDREVRDLQVRGSARLTAFLRGQVGPADDRLGALAATGRDLSSALRAPLSRVAVTAAAVTLALMALGTRNLLFQPLPAVGDLSAFPASAVDLLRTHASGWRTTAGGGTAPSPTGNGAFGLLGLLSFGSMGLARKLAILALLPAGPLGIWRLARPIGSIRAGATAVVVYAAVPVPYNALADGSWAALAAYASVPWIVLGLARAMGLAPFGRADMADAEAEAAIAPTSVPARLLGLGLAVGLAGIITPAIVPLTGLVAGGLLVGSVVAGRVAGLFRLLVTAIGGVVVAVALHLPWSASLLVDGGGWDAVVGAGGAQVPPIGELLRFESGPFGGTPLGWAILAAAALPLVIGRGWRLAWAVRAWFVALAGWGTLLAAEQGWLPFDLPPTELLLVPAAVGLALSAALGMAAFEVDLRHYGFGWRQGASILAALAVLAGGVTLAPAIVGGRWDVPRGDLNRALAPTLADDGAREARVLWLGDPELLPLGGHRDDDVALATSDGLPDVTTHWPGARHTSTDRLADAVRLASERRTVHLGRLLGPEGVRYIVVPTSAVPEAFNRGPQEAPRGLTDTLAAQLDLEQVPTDQSLIVYRNTAWRGMATAVPAATDLPDAPEGAAALDPDDWETVVESSDAESFGVRAPAERVVVAAVPAEDRWALELDGDDATSGPAYGWALRSEGSDGGEGTVAYDTAPAHVALVAAQPLLWVLVLVGRNRLSRRAARRGATPEPAPAPPGPAVDPVESAAVAVAGLAARTEAATADADAGEASRRHARRRRRKGGR